MIVCCVALSSGTSIIAAFFIGLECPSLSLIIRHVLGSINFYHSNKFYEDF